MRMRELIELLDDAPPDATLTVGSEHGVKMICHVSYLMDRAVLRVRSHIDDEQMTVRDLLGSWLNALTLGQADIDTVLYVEPIHPEHRHVARVSLIEVDGSERLLNAEAS